MSGSSSRSYKVRTQTWWRLLNEYDELRKVYESHAAEGFFVYGTEAGPFSELAKHPAFQELCALRRGSGKSNVEFEDDFAVLPTYLPIEEGAAACLGVLGLASADLFELRSGGVAQTVRVKRSDAGLSTAGYMFLEIDAAHKYTGSRGFEATIEAEGKVNPVRKAYECGDGTYVFMHGGFPKLKKGILDFFEATPTVESIANGAKRWSSGVDLESAMRQKGLAVTMCRTPAEWRECEQGKAIGDLPPVCVETIETSGDVAPRLLKPAGIRPLADVVVVDFSHVIASPMVGRTLSEHGATVFKIVSSKRPRRKLFDEETNSGKHTIELDLEDASDKDRLWHLIAAADVLIDGYTKGVLGRFGFDQDTLFAKCPHLVYLKVSCYGHVGPWSTYKGFQQNANFATGVATVQDEALLCYQLTSQVDYTTGFLGALGVILALTDRQSNALKGKTTGHLVHVSLCQAATWMAQFSASMPERADYVSRITRLIWRLDHRMVTDGNVKYLPPALTMTKTPPHRYLGFQRWWKEEG